MRRFAMTIFSPTQRCNIYCCDIVLNACNIVPTLQCCVALKIVIANCPVQHHLKTDVEYFIPVWDSLPVSKDSTCTLSPTFNQMTNQTIMKKIHC